MSVKLIVDSVADLPIDLAQKLDITIWPLLVNFGDDSYLDGVELTSEAFFDKLTSANALPTTSQISVGRFIEYFSALKDKEDDYIYLSIGSRFSGTYNSALTALEEVNADNIYIRDSETVTGDYGVMALALAHKIKCGATLDEVLGVVDRVNQQTITRVCLDTLEYLKRGGRLSATSAAIGTLLGVKPIIARVNGEIVSISKVRGRKKLNKYIKDFLNEYDLNNKVVAITYAVNLDYMNELKTLVLSTFPEADVYVLPAGSVVGTHAGPGMIAISFVNIDKNDI